MSTNQNNDDRLNKLAKERLEVQEKVARAAFEASQNVKSYTEFLNKGLEIKRQILNSDKIIKKLGDKIEKHKKGITILSEEQLAIAVEAEKLAKSSNDKLIKELELRIKANSEISKTKVALRETVKISRDFGNSLKQNALTARNRFNYFLEERATIKETERSFGMLSRHTKSYRDGLYSAAKFTNTIGVNAGDLAKSQSQYSESLGRATILTEDQLKNMALMAEGTGLGMEAITTAASDLDMVGASFGHTLEVVNDSRDASAEMGLHSAKVLKNVNANLKLANKVVFKGGIKGLTNITALATRFKMDLNEISGFSDKIFTPEGAVEMASKLSVLGGEFNKLSDPFKLMYQARNDFEGLNKDILQSTKGMAQFNKEMGSFEISGMNMQRLKEVANATGLSYEMLASQSKELAKSDLIKGKLKMKGLSSKESEFISSLAQFNKEKGEFEVKLLGANGESITKTISELDRSYKDQLKASMEQKDTLEEQAKNAVNFDKSVTRIWNTIKSNFAPSLEIFANNLDEIMKDVIDYLKGDNIFKKLGGFIKSASELFDSKGMTAFAVGLTTFGVTIGKGLYNATKWILSGRMLRRGFDMGGATGGKSMGSGILGRTAKNTIKGGGLSGQMGKFGRGMARGGMAKGGMMAVGGLAANMGREYLDDRDSGFGKTLGVLGKTATSAGTGAMIGSMVPVIGTAAGAVLGGGYGLISSLLEEGIIGNNTNKPVNPNNQMNDFISRPNQPAVPFTSKDTLIGAKKDGPIDKLLNNSADTKSVKNNTNNQNITFSPIKLEGSIKLEGDSKSKDILLNDDNFISELTKSIQEQIVKNINGGRTSYSPSI
jgi:hypothetical protein